MSSAYVPRPVPALAREERAPTWPSGGPPVSDAERESADDTAAWDDTTAAVHKELIDLDPLFTLRRRFQDWRLPDDDPDAEWNTRVGEDDDEGKRESSKTTRQRGEVVESRIYSVGQRIVRAAVRRGKPVEGALRLFEMQTMAGKKVRSLWRGKVDMHLRQTLDPLLRELNASLGACDWGVREELASLTRDAYLDDRIWYNSELYEDSDEGDDELDLSPFKRRKQSTPLPTPRSPALFHSLAPEIILHILYVTANLFTPDSRATPSDRLVLDGRRRRVMSSAALVCRAWRGPAQAELCSSVVLRRNTSLVGLLGAITPGEASPVRRVTLASWEIDGFNDDPGVWSWFPQIPTVELMGFISDQSILGLMSSWRRQAHSPEVQATTLILKSCKIGSSIILPPVIRSLSLVKCQFGALGAVLPWQHSLLHLTLLHNSHLTPLHTSPLAPSIILSSDLSPDPTSRLETLLLDTTLPALALLATRPARVYRVEFAVDRQQGKQAGKACREALDLSLGLPGLRELWLPKSKGWIGLRDEVEARNGEKVEVVWKEETDLVGGRKLWKER